jgi:hypothetical protein
VLEGRDGERGWEYDPTAAPAPDEAGLTVQKSGDGLGRFALHTLNRGPFVRIPKSIDNANTFGC